MGRVQTTVTVTFIVPEDLADPHDGTGMTEEAYEEFCSNFSYDIVEGPSLIGSSDVKMAEGADKKANDQEGFPLGEGATTSSTDDGREGDQDGPRNQQKQDPRPMTNQQEGQA